MPNKLNRRSVTSAAIALTGLAIVFNFFAYPELLQQKEEARQQAETDLILQKFAPECRGALGCLDYDDVCFIDRVGVEVVLSDEGMDGLDVKPIKNQAGAYVIQISASKPVSPENMHKTMNFIRIAQEVEGRVLHAPTDASSSSPPSAG